LGGTKTKFLKLSPTNLETDYTRRWAKERGNEFLHLGGGVGGSKDSLYNFKAGFSKQRHTFLTMRLVIDEKKYIELVKLRAKYLNIEVEKLLKTDFFPAYRSSN
jgi:lipid II:glycine glycyltransferase (peptidoglycan interpeptide bridge formation enzyme)